MIHCDTVGIHGYIASLRNETMYNLLTILLLAAVQLKKGTAQLI